MHRNNISMQRQQYKHFKLENNLIFDFHKLACLEPSLRPYVLILNCRTVCNFKNQHSLIAITKAIMRHCFNLEWSCPYSNLCPRIPARVNYLLWVHLQLQNIQISTVLDIGTGASLIYPLLGHKIFGWKFIATEINRESYECSKNLSEIDLRLLQTVGAKDNDEDQYCEQAIIRNIVKDNQAIDVVVCNPPFFEQQQQTLTQMADNQHHTTGGEYQFMFNIYRESFSMLNIKYFTCLIGLYRNFKQIKKFLIVEFQQGFLQLLRFGQIKQGNSLRYIVLWKVKSLNHIANISVKQAI